MATVTRKVLGQTQPVAATLTALYTVPAVTQTIGSSLVICNTGGADTTVRVSVAVAAAADALSQYQYYDLPVRAKDTFTATVGLTLGAADVVRCWSGNGLVAFSLFGEERA